MTEINRPEEALTRAAIRLSLLLDRLARIAEAHHKEVDAAGGTFGDCTECWWAWPCPTYAWATTDRDPVADPWDPNDDTDTDKEHP
jgi:hypothetical protein